MTCPGYFSMELPSEASFPLSNHITMITVKMSFNHFHSSSFQGKYSFIKIMQSISPNYNLENVRNSTMFVNSLMNITIVLKFIFIIDAFREYNSHLQDITS